MGWWKTLGMRMLMKVVRHLWFVSCWLVIMRSWSYIAGWSQSKDGFKTTMSIFWFGCMISRSWGMVSWFRSMVSWGMVRFRVICCFDSKYLFK